MSPGLLLSMLFSANMYFSPNIHSVVLNSIISLGWPQGPSPLKGAAAGVFLDGLLASTAGEGAGQQAIKQKVQHRGFILPYPRCIDCDICRHRHRPSLLHYSVTVS